MQCEWHKTRYPGIRFRKHHTRKNGVQFDKYFSIYYKVNGHQREEGVGWQSQGWKIDDVADVLGKIRRNIRKGQGPQSLAEMRALQETERQQKLLEQQRLERENITFSDFFEDYFSPVSQSNKKPESYRKEQSHYNIWLKPIVGNIALKNIVPLHIERIKKNLLDKNRSPRTIEYVLSTFRVCWNQARRDGYIRTDSPTKQVRIPRVDNQRERFLSPQEVDSLLEAVKQKSVLCYDICLLSYHTGMRAGEIFNLKWGAVNIERGIIIVHGKGDKTRPVSMTQEVKRIFNIIGGGDPDQLVFVDENGNRIGKISNSFFKCVNDLNFNHGVIDRRQRICFHTLRHSFASQHVQAGTDLFVVQSMLGHSTPTMTMRYSHLGRSTLARAQQRFEQSINASRFPHEKETNNEAIGLAES